MKKNDWEYLAKALWAYSNNHEGRISSLLKELVITVHKNMEVIIDDNDKDGKIARSDGRINPNTTGNIDFEGTGEF
tara:strand:+ start:648 stop:875 length:228 start_codon:yes stop_codon:yes gene_type:complete